MAGHSTAQSGLHTPLELSPIKKGSADSIYAPLAGHEVQQRIAGLTNSAVALPTDTTDLNILVRALSKGQLFDALIAIAQQMARS